MHGASPRPSTKPEVTWPISSFLVVGSKKEAILPQACHKVKWYAFVSMHNWMDASSKLVISLAWIHFCSNLGTMHVFFTTHPAKIAPKFATNHSIELKPLMQTPCAGSSPSCMFRQKKSKHLYIFQSNLIFLFHSHSQIANVLQNNYFYFTPHEKQPIYWTLIYIH